MLGRNVDDPDLLEVVERTVEPFVPEEHAATAPVDAATQVNHQWRSLTVRAAGL
jgi:hypothetical protein